MHDKPFLILDLEICRNLMLLRMDGQWQYSRLKILVSTGDCKLDFFDPSKYCIIARVPYQADLLHPDNLHNRVSNSFQYTARSMICVLKKKLSSNSQNSPQDKSAKLRLLLSNTNLRYMCVTV